MTKFTGVSLTHCAILEFVNKCLEELQKEEVQRRAGGHRASAK